VGAIGALMCQSVAVADLAVRSERQDGRILLRVSGELDLATVEILRHAAAKELDAGEFGELALDLSGLSFLDSSGLGALLQIRGEAMAQGGAFTIAGLSAGPARIISIAGLSSTFGVPEA
jgi:anti-anti-sigma factor